MAEIQKIIFRQALSNKIYKEEPESQMEKMHKKYAAQ
jgi:hypothetical protein